MVSVEYYSRSNKYSRRNYCLVIIIDSYRLLWTPVNLYGLLLIYYIDSYGFLLTYYNYK